MNRPFKNFTKAVIPQSPSRLIITQNINCPEDKIIPKLIKEINISSLEEKNIKILSKELTKTLRSKKKCSIRKKEIVQDFLQEFSLASQEGISLMCLAEALLRIPDKFIQNKLIKDKISNTNWKDHIGKSKSMIVNTVTRGLIISSKIINNKNKIINISRKLLLSLINLFLKHAIKLVGKQFIVGENIQEALRNAKKLEKKGFLYSYDILGEAALTQEDAINYFSSYKNAIKEIGISSNDDNIYTRPSISIKLSALHPRYCRSQYKRVMKELYQRLLEITLLAKKYNIGINIDAEESERLDISLDLVTKLCLEPNLIGWDGVGFVVQAYQKRCFLVIDELIEIAKASKRKLMIRLVKGAYWDREIKRAQMEGMDDYPVFTRKVYTDISYLACARKLLSKSNYIYPQFATHNAQTLSSIYYFAGGKEYYEGKYEFQCLYGMGESLYKQVVGGKLNKICRIYAPVGTHKTLLSYLVRRLLENGANTSFVNKIADSRISLEDLLISPMKEIKKIEKAENKVGLSNPKIPLPCKIYKDKRLNSKGIDLNNEYQLYCLSKYFENCDYKPIKVKPITFNNLNNKRKIYKIYNPYNNFDVVGNCQVSTEQEIKNACNDSYKFFLEWSKTNYKYRANILKKISNIIESEIYYLISLIVRESGKNINNAIYEIREAVDFLRYYANQAELYFNDNCKPIGPVLCISPWNFPLAIFIGQISAALVAGNTVIAKPSEQTTLIAAKIVDIMIQAGIPKGVIQLMIGSGDTVGMNLAKNQNIAGIMFTGSNKVAKSLQNIISKRLCANGKTVTFIAETGGINAMIVDSSALLEQVVIDVINSAFDSAGQRCSALRLLCVQDDIADNLLNMLKGAMNEYVLGNPANIETDIGPVINFKAKLNIKNHIEKMKSIGCKVWHTSGKSEINTNDNNSFVPLTLIEITKIDQLKDEVFGPVLHILKYKGDTIKEIIKKINKNGYGLTLGLHTRTDTNIKYVLKYANVGNIYINRNMIGAVVGIQPFGGLELSGTGPKAGGPLYIYRLLSKGFNKSVISNLERLKKEYRYFENNCNSVKNTIYSDLIYWIEKNHPKILEKCKIIYNSLELDHLYELQGYTGEKNIYRLLPKKNILCISDLESDSLLQLTAVITIGAKVLWLESKNNLVLMNKLPTSVKNSISIIDDYDKNKKINAVLFHGNCNNLLNLCRKIAGFSGPVISINSYSNGDYEIELEKLLVEQTITINTTAIGGNTSLVNIN